MFIKYKILQAALKNTLCRKNIYIFLLIKRTCSFSAFINIMTSHTGVRADGAEVRAAQEDEGEGEEREDWEEEAGGARSEDKGGDGKEDPRREEEGRTGEGEEEERGMVQKILQGCHFTWENLEFGKEGKKNLEKPEFLTIFTI